MSNKRYNQFYYTSHKMPVQLDCSWTVDSTNAAGISGLTGAGIANVYMHSGSPSSANPNPAAGYAIIELQDSFNDYYFGGAQIQSPNSGSDINISGTSVMTVGAVYVISAVGTTTTAQWQAAGLPVGVVPAVGLPFVSKITGGGSGTGKVQAPAAVGAGIEIIDIVGSPGLSVNSVSANVGGLSGSAYMILRFLAATDSTTTTLIATAPANGSVIKASLVLSNSRIKVQGS